MEDELAFVQLQLWVVIGLLAFFVLTNLLCRIFGCEWSDEKIYAKMWQKGEVDKLLKLAELRLAENPHDIGALYFGARAMVARGRNDDARRLLERLSVIEPSLRSACQEEIGELSRSASDD